MVVGRAIITDLYTGPDRRNANSLFRKVKSWLVGLAATAITGALGYMAHVALLQAARVPIIEERLTNHSVQIDIRLRRVEDGIDFLVKREMDRAKGKQE